MLDVEFKQSETLKDSKATLTKDGDLQIFVPWKPLKPLRLETTACPWGPSESQLVGGLVG